MKQILALARKNLILTSCVILATCIVTVLAPWILRFHATDFSASPSDWGVFGDYLGGALSTIISALGLIGIIATIKSQSDTLSTQLSSIVQEKEIRDDAVYSKQ